MDYIRHLDFENVEVKLIENQRQGIHNQTNKLLRYCENLEFDFAFKTDDDIVFLQPGWDCAYYEAAKQSGYWHLCLTNEKWFQSQRQFRGLKPTAVHYENLIARTNSDDVSGCFWTFTKEILKTVGFFDVKSFGFRGFGHLDYTWRCCRRGYNDINNIYDLDSSQNYINLVTEDYRTAIVKEHIPNENEYKKREILYSNRNYIPYNEIDFNDGNRKLNQYTGYLSKEAELLKAYMKEIVCKTWAKYGENIAVFGAGKHTEWLFDILNEINVKPCVIIDDNSQISSFAGIPVKTFSQFEPSKIKAVFISSDESHNKMTTVAEKTLNGQEIDIIDPYASMHGAPYLKN